MGWADEIVYHYDNYTVRIRDNATGEIRECEQGVGWHDSSVFWWTEGNMGCDCNRRIEFIRASGRQPTDEEWDIPCTDDKYTAIDATMPDGKVIVLDGE